MDQFIYCHFRRFLQRCIAVRYAVLAGALALLLLALGLVQGNWIRTVMFPDIPSDMLTAQVQLLPGATEKQLDETVSKLEAALSSVDAAYYRQHGQHLVRYVSVSMENERSALLEVELLKSQQRQLDTFEVARQWRQALPPLTGIEILDISGAITQGPGNDLAFELSGRNRETLVQASAELRRAMSAYKGVYDVRDSDSGGKPELKITLKPAAAAVGVTLADVSRQVRHGLYGSEVLRLAQEGEERRIMVRLPAGQRRHLADLMRLDIRTATGNWVPLAQVANLTWQAGMNNITRVDGIRTVIVSAKVDKTLAQPGMIQQALEQKVLPQILASYPDVYYGLSGGARELEQAADSLTMGMVLAALLVYGLMAIVLRSYAKPLLVMAVIPFGLVGALAGHLLFGMPLSMLSMFGMIALSGVLVNDSLLLVYTVNQHDARDMTTSVVAAATSRFRAIVLTSLTTFAGLLPIMSETALQAQVLIPMAVSMAFGILLATPATLIVLPCLLVVVSDFQRYLMAVGLRRMTRDNDKPLERAA